MTNPFSLFTRYVFFFLEIIGSINLIDTFCLQTTMEGVTAHVSSFFYFLSACVFRKNWRICLSVFVLKSICFAVPVLERKTKLCAGGWIPTWHFRKSYHKILCLEMFNYIKPQVASTKQTPRCALKCELVIFEVKF